MSLFKRQKPVEVEPEIYTPLEFDDLGHPMLPYPTWSLGNAREAAAYCLHCERNVNIIIARNHMVGDYACPYCFQKHLVSR